MLSARWGYEFIAPCEELDATSLSESPMPIETSPFLSLPYMQEAQAQKHVTHNEALRILDVAVQLVVKSRSYSAPPASAVEKDRFIVGANATVEWAGHDGEIAIYEGGAYWFVAPLPGWTAFVLDEDQVAKATAANAWETDDEDQVSFSKLGINASIDASHQLTVTGQSSLFTGDSAGHQVVLNKTAETDTTSLLFQTNYEGRAEIGLAGSDSLSFKTSVDGSTWQTVLQVDPNSGTVSGKAIMQSPSDTTSGRLMRADYGYCPGNVLGAVSETSGTPTGALIETGSNTNGTYQRFADGTQVCASELSSSAANSVLWTFPVAFVSAPTSCSATPAATLPRFATAHSSTETTVSVDCWTTADIRATEQVYVMAFGRWF